MDPTLTHRLASLGHRFYLREQYCLPPSRHSDTILNVTTAGQDKVKKKKENLIQADPQAVAVEVCVLAGLTGLSGGQCPEVAGWPAGRWWWRRWRGVLLVAQVLILQHIICVLPLHVAWDRRDDGPAEGDAHQKLGLPVYQLCVQVAVSRWGWVHCLTPPWRRWAGCCAAAA